MLAQSYEYRLPSARAVTSAANATSSGSGSTTVKANMTSRYLGLIVIPGQHIIKIEVEEVVDDAK